MFSYKTRWFNGMIVWLLVSSSPVVANEVIGKTYPIAEENLLTVITRELKQKQAQGEFDIIEESVKKKTKKYLQRPPPVDNITVTNQPSTHYFNPSITVPYDIRDAQGRVIHPAGTRVNPLDYRDLRHRLLFFNSDDTKQVEWVKKLARDEGTSYKLIMVAGSPTETMKQLNTRVSFDQQGVLVNKLDIKQVPAVVYQEGKLLRIDEVLP